MFKFVSEVGGNSIGIDYDGPPENIGRDVGKYIDEWFDFINPPQDQAKVDQLTARLRAANDKLKSAVDQNTPSTT